MLFVNGCTSSTNVTDVFNLKIKQIGSPIGKQRNSRARSAASIALNNAHPRFDGVQQQGSGKYISSRAPIVRRAQTRDGQEGHQINLVDAPIAAVAKKILGEILQVDYVVHPEIQGTLTLQTSSPMPDYALVEIFEVALAANGIALVLNGSSYQILPRARALLSTPAISIPAVTSKKAGIRINVFELQHIAADEMKTILEPITQPGSILRIDHKRNYLMIAGSLTELSSVQEAIRIFDLDWMRGQSVALHPIKIGDPSAIANELETIFDAKDGANKSLIKFIPNNRLQSVLVIAAKPSQLSRAANWITKLDSLAKTKQRQLFVYQVQNRTAKQLSDVIQSMLADGTQQGSTAEQNSVAPNLDQTSLSTAQNDAPDHAKQTSRISKSSVKIVPDVENNSLLISTTADEYQKITRILAQLDVLPTQVLIEAVIAEVTLNDQLKFGVRWAIENGGLNIGLSDLATGLASQAFPGFSFSFASSNIQATINTLASITDVKVVSAPTLMALNNQKAVLQVGDQVPIVTQQSAGTITPNAPVINSVELKDTGIILTVLPRVNAAGRVLLNIDQEVSSVVRTTSSGIDSPTIQQRKISTRVMVNDGESIALGGLIQERNSLTRKQIPIIGDIPLIGNLFKDKEDNIRKTELIIFIRPRVITDISEARDVTSEFRRQLRLDSAISRRRGGENTTKQNIRRLVY